MSHVSPSHRAHPTDHAVRRYAERVLGLDAEGLDDRQALARAQAQGIDCGWIRRRLAELGGIVVATGMRDGAVVVPLEGMTLRVVRGAVVTVLTPPLGTSVRRGRALSRAAA
ncbi:hypothetical protein [Methylobacterium sp. SD21]|uniref:hypothetical protein n=1 Tax=Methylobacterium litchii TaxID=3138810 RepID=UPI00313B6A58